MPKQVWVTDPHFNFISMTQFHQFMAGVAEHRPDAVLLGGDIVEARGQPSWCRVDCSQDRLQCGLARPRRPLYFPYS